MFDIQHADNIFRRYMLRGKSIEITDSGAGTCYLYLSNGDYTGSSLFLDTNHLTVETVPKGPR